MVCPWDSPGKDIGVVCHSHLQGTFLTQVLNLGLLHCRQILYRLNHLEDMPLCPYLRDHVKLHLPYSIH